MVPKLTLYVVEGGVTRMHPVPVDENLRVEEDEVRAGWQRLGLVSFEDPLTQMVMEFMSRKRAVVEN